jgi:hypothetical protein
MVASPWPIHLFLSFSGNEPADLVSVALGTYGEIQTMRMLAIGDE